MIPVTKELRIEEDNKEARLVARSQIEVFKESLQELAGSARGDADAINADGLTETLIGGLYTRLLRIPKDTAMVSELWKKERIWIILEGSVIVTTELGTMKLNAGYIGPAPFGSKAAVYSEEETLWAAIASVDAEKLEDVRGELIADDYAELSYSWDSIEEDSKWLG